MSQFRCLFIDESDKVAAIQPCEGTTESEAVDRAYGMLCGHPHASAVELWASGHFVARIAREVERLKT
jgi:hypothetical protein